MALSSLYRCCPASVSSHFSQPPTHQSVSIIPACDASCNAQRASNPPKTAELSAHVGLRQRVHLRNFSQGNLAANIFYHFV